MSILIKGMEMPNDGREHKALVQFLTDGTCRAVVDYSTSYADRHIKVFPVVSVSESAGHQTDDLISRENALACACGDTCGNDPKKCGDLDCCTRAVFMKIPAAVRNVACGKNTTEENPVDQFVCSQCGIILEGYFRKEIDEDDGSEFCFEYEPKYCPECGVFLTDKEEDRNG